MRYPVPLGLGLSAPDTPRGPLEGAGCPPHSPEGLVCGPEPAHVAAGGEQQQPDQGQAEVGSRAAGDPPGQAGDEVDAQGGAVDWGEGARGERGAEPGHSPPWTEAPMSAGTARPEKGPGGPAPHLLHAHRTGAHQKGALLPNPQALTARAQGGLLACPCPGLGSLGGAGGPPIPALSTHTATGGRSSSPGPGAR